MKRTQRARRISAREQARRRRQRDHQQHEAEQRAAQARQQRLPTLTEHDVAASASGVHRIPPGLLTFGGATTIANRTQMWGR